jgi:hypothetical protein
MPKHIEILHYNYIDDKVFIYTPPTGETIDSNTRKFLIDYINKKLSDSVNKSKIDSDKSIGSNLFY